MSDSEPRTTVDPNTDLAERLARVEQQNKHQSEVLERIETQINEDHDQLAERVGEIEPQHKRLWFTYQGAKWVMVVGSSSSLLAAFVSVLIL